MDRNTTDIQSHIHDGLMSQLINFTDIFGYTEPINVISQTIGTAAGNYDAYFLAPRSLRVFQVDFSAVDALAANNTNYITWTLTNLGQAGAGTGALLGTNNTTVTNGSAIAANTKRTFVLTTALNDLNVIQGDRIRIRAAVTGTLANSVTFPVYLIQSQ